MAQAYQELNLFGDQGKIYEVLLKFLNFLKN